MGWGWSNSNFITWINAPHAKIQFSVCQHMFYRKRTVLNTVQIFCNLRSTHLAKLFSFLISYLQLPCPSLSTELCSKQFQGQIQPKRILRMKEKTYCISLVKFKKSFQQKTFKILTVLKKHEWRSKYQIDTKNKMGNLGLRLLHH